MCKKFFATSSDSDSNVVIRSVSATLGQAPSMGSR